MSGKGPILGIGKGYKEAPVSAIAPEKIERTRARQRKFAVGRPHLAANGPAAGIVA
jgi:hypothetical protein